jgi:ABC-2 type transport system ATP-binding protein
MGILELEEVEKSYGSHEVLKGVNLKVEEGEIYGLLGPNGAGKTTLFQTIMGLLKPDSGSIHIDGQEHDQGKDIKREIGYLPSDISFYDDMSARENLKYFADLADKEPDIDSLLELVDLVEDQDRNVGDFSTGMKKRLGIAQSLIKDPKIAIYDEPTTGLDPEGKNKFRRHVEKVNEEKNMTVIISSHITGEISPLCDRFGILTEGKIKVSGTKEELGKEAGTGLHLDIEAHNPDKVEEVLESLDSEYTRSKDSFKVQAEAERNHILEELVANQADITKFNISESTLESTYLEITGGE